MGMFSARRAGYPNSVALRLFVEEAQMALARAEAGAANARAFVLFDGNNAEELAAARAQWKELKSLGIAVTYCSKAPTGAGK